MFQHDFKMRRGNYLAEAFNAPRSCLQTLMTCCYVWLRCICCSYFTATRIFRQSDEAAQAAGLTGTPNESAERGESAPAQTRYRPNMTSAARRSERSNVSVRFAFKSHARMQSRMPSQQVLQPFLKGKGKPSPLFQQHPLSVCALFAMFSLLVRPRCLK